MITAGETYFSDEYLVENEETGQLDDANVTVTITLPNGSTDTPTLQHPSLGVYSFTYPTSLVGRHPFTVSATGGFLGSTVVKLAEDMFHVDDASTAVQLVSLRETKDFLNIAQDKTQNDEEIRRKIVAASAMVERATNLWHHTTVVETLPSTSPLFLTSLPVTAMISVQQDSTTFDAATYRVTQYGELAPGYGYPYVPWATTASYADLTVTYEAGETTVPVDVREAVLKTVLDLWESQRGAASLPLQAGLEEVEQVTLDALSAEAEKLLRPWLRGPVMA